MCYACGISNVTRIERSRRYLIRSHIELSNDMKTAFASYIHDRMTECVYKDSLKTFFNGSVPASFKIIPILEEG